MRLWHYKLIPFLPKSQLLAQWRELNSIFKKQDRHILINYIYEYPKRNLYIYTLQVLIEMRERQYKVKSLENFQKYIEELPSNDWVLKPEWQNPFPNHHDFFYLRQCYYNLEEKFMRCQKDFSYDEYWRLAMFYNNELNEWRLER